MTGLARIAKMYGAITINGQKLVWDYANDEAVPEEEMPQGSKRHAESERAKWTKLSAEQVAAWGTRHDVQGSLADLRCMIEDARSLSPGDDK